MTRAGNRVVALEMWQIENEELKLSGLADCVQSEGDSKENSQISDLTV